jgi:hypothetical protein
VDDVVALQRRQRDGGDLGMGAEAAAQVVREPAKSRTTASKTAES